MVVKNENYIAVQGWMVNVLQLKGNELLIYALIYGFSQVDGQVYNGGLQYLADWVNGTKQGVSKNLNSLLEKGLIEKKEKIINNVKFCEYYATEFNGVLNNVEGGIQQSLTGGIKQSLPNNIINDTTINNKKINKETNKKENEFDSLINNFTQDKETRILLNDWLDVRKAKRAPMTEKAITLNLNKLVKCANDSNLSINQYLEEVIMRGWQAFYVINNGIPKGQPKTSQGSEYANLG